MKIMNEDTIVADGSSLYDQQIAPVTRILESLEKSANQFLLSAAALVEMHAIEQKRIQNTIYATWDRIDELTMQLRRSGEDIADTTKTND